jgi:hypothetical protein
VIEDRKKRRQSTFICFVDMQKAFDTVNRECLWEKLANIGVNGKMYFAIKALYDGVTCSVRVNGMYTDWFEVDLGSKAGLYTFPVSIHYFH